MTVKRFYLFFILIPFLLCGCQIKISTNEVTASLPYQEWLFDASIVHKIDIAISEEDWIDLLENPKEKTKYHVDVTVDGERYEDVSFATKGNISLTAIA